MEWEKGIMEGSLESQLKLWVRQGDVRTKQLAGMEDTSRDSLRLEVSVCLLLSVSVCLCVCLSLSLPSPHLTNMCVLFFYFADG